MGSPSGNTLICATTTGYLVEVDASGNVVWEYINPVTGSGAATALGDRLPMTNTVPRAVRYAASFAGFQGHTMTPGSTFTGAGYPVFSGTTRTAATPGTPVWVTSTMVDNELLVVGTDPKRHADSAWKIVERATGPAAGSLFLSTHPRSPHLWMDMPLAANAEFSQAAAVFRRDALGEGHRRKKCQRPDWLSSD